MVAVVVRPSVYRAGTKRNVFPPDTGMGICMIIACLRPPNVVEEVNLNRTLVWRLDLWGSATNHHAPARPF